MFSVYPASEIPRFTVEPQSSYVTPGSSLSLSCDAVPSHSVTLRWTLNGSLVSPPPRRIDVHEGTLRIGAFSPSGVSPSGGAVVPGGAQGGDEGVYQCLATNQAGTIVSREARIEAAGEEERALSPSPPEGGFEFCGCHDGNFLVVMMLN